LTRKHRAIGQRHIGLHTIDTPYLATTVDIAHRTQSTHMLSYFFAFNIACLMPHTTLFLVQEKSQIHGGDETTPMMFQW
jgi:hypothetical protein